MPLLNIRVKPSSSLDVLSPGLVVFDMATLQGLRRAESEQGPPGYFVTNLSPNLAPNLVIH